MLPDFHDPQPSSAFVAGLREGLTLDRCPVRPYDHQVFGVHWLLNKPYAGIFDEPGAGKTIQVIIAAQLLFLARIIDRVVVVSPPDARTVWYDKEIGEIGLHSWGDSVPYRVSEFHSKIRQWDGGDWKGTDRQLRWIITNYEFVRAKQRTYQLKPFCGARTLIVFDEASEVKNKQAQQTKACFELRKSCGRVVLLDGTPVAESPLDMLSLGNLIHPDVLGIKYITQFREQFCVMVPNVDYPAVKAWKNLDILQQRFKPYVIRRLKKDCLDLPPQMPPVAIECTLTPATWHHYKRMRDDMLAYVTATEASAAPHAMVKGMRLAQITSGLLGGVESIFDDDDDLDHEAPSWMELEAATGPRPETVDRKVVEIGREKLDTALGWVKRRLHEDPNFKLLVLFQHRPELDRALPEFKALKGFNPEHVLAVHGNQKKSEREVALRLLHPRTAPPGPAILMATYSTGSMAHNYSAAHNVLRVSHTGSLKDATQYDQRVHRPGQTQPVSYYDIVAVGPAGQKTVDHAILKRRRDKGDLAAWTSAAWVVALGD